MRRLLGVTPSSEPWGRAQPTEEQKEATRVRMQRLSEYEREREVLMAELLEKDGIIDILREHVQAHQ